MEKYTRDLVATVTIEVNDANVIDRCVNNEPTPSNAAPDARWRDQFYGLDTREKVLEHLAYHALMNGVVRANRLDGWADLPDDAATMDVESVGFW